jgi:hypothetical protein
VLTCDHCEEEISGPRYSCSTCIDFDLCSTCVQSSVAHPHDLQLCAPTTAATPALDSNDAMQMLAAFPHAAVCAGCELAHCTRVRRMVDHLLKCPANTTCTSCRRVLLFLANHARVCKLPTGTCKVLQCEKLRNQSRSHAIQSSDRRMAATMKRQTEAPSSPASDSASPQQRSSQVMGGRRQEKS